MDARSIANMDPRRMTDMYPLYPTHPMGFPYDQNGAIPLSHLHPLSKDGTFIHAREIILIRHLLRYLTNAHEDKRKRAPFETRKNSDYCDGTLSHDTVQQQVARTDSYSVDGTCWFAGTRGGYGIYLSPDFGRDVDYRPRAVRISFLKYSPTSKKDVKIKTERNAAAIRQLTFESYNNMLLRELKSDGKRSRMEIFIRCMGMGPHIFMGYGSDIRLLFRGDRDIATFISLIQPIRAFVNYTDLRNVKNCQVIHDTCDQALTTSTTATDLPQRLGRGMTPEDWATLFLGEEENNKLASLIRASPMENRRIPKRNTANKNRLVFKSIDAGLAAAAAFSPPQTPTPAEEDDYYSYGGVQDELSTYGSPPNTSYIEALSQPEWEMGLQEIEGFMCGSDEDVDMA